MIRRKFYPDRAGAMEKLTSHLEDRYTRRGFQVQIIRVQDEDDRGCIFQARKGYGSDLAEVASKLTGLDTTVTARIRIIKDSLDVEVGGGKWLDKALVAGFAAFVTFSFLIIPAGIGAVKQHQLILDMTDEIDWFLNNLDNVPASGQEVNPQS